jgi:hypothetical protein
MEVLKGVALSDRYGRVGIRAHEGAGPHICVRYLDVLPAEAARRNLLSGNGPMPVPMTSYRVVSTTSGRTMEFVTASPREDFVAGTVSIIARQKP